MADATAIVINYQRPETMERIVRSLLAVERFAKIIVADNSGSLALPPWLLNMSGFEDTPGRVHWWNVGENKGPWARWAAAMQLAETDAVCFQDDDCVVLNWDLLLGLWDDARHERIVHALSPGHLKTDRCEYRLVGWGAVLNRNWISPAYVRYRDVYGHESILESKADRILTALMEREEIAVPYEIDEFPSCRGPMAMYRKADHRRLINEAMSRTRMILRGGR